MVDVPAFLRGKPVSNHESVKLTQVAIDSPSMQLCSVWFDASCAIGFANLLHPIGTKTSIMKIWILFLIWYKKDTFWHRQNHELSMKEISFCCVLKQY